MIPAPFEYERAETVGHALELLAEHGDDAKLLAGGHSLLPLMKLRLATPAVLVDIGRLDDLSGVRVDGGEVVIGALTRHRAIETDPLLLADVPLLPAVARTIGDPQVRRRGTIGGSLVHGDPASDLPAAVLALGATLVVEGPSGRRDIPATAFFEGFLETAVGEDEVLVEIRVPRLPDARWSFQKFTRRSMDWAIVGAAVVSGPGVPGGTGVGLVNMDSRPVLATATQEALARGASAGEAAELAAEGCEPPADLNASSAYRQHLAQVLVRRALDDAGIG